MFRLHTTAIYGVRMMVGAFLQIALRVAFPDDKKKVYHRW